MVETSKINLTEAAAPVPTEKSENQAIQIAESNNPWAAPLSSPAANKDKESSLYPGINSVSLLAARRNLGTSHELEQMMEEHTRRATEKWRCVVLFHQLIQALGGCRRCTKA